MTQRRMYYFVILLVRYSDITLCILLLTKDLLLTLCTIFSFKGILAKGSSLPHSIAPSLSLSSSLFNILHSAKSAMTHNSLQKHLRPTAGNAKKKKVYVCNSKAAVRYSIHRDYVQPGVRSGCVCDGCMSVCTSILPLLLTIFSEFRMNGYLCQ
jgi:hypothetical protein